jgi:hypothetical protein
LPAGASFKAGRGVLVTGETRTILGVEVAEVTERPWVNQIRFAVQVFGEKHHHALNQEDHTGCALHASGFLPARTVSAVQAGQLVRLFNSTNSAVTGVVIAVHKALALGEAEIVIGVSNATAALKPGEFVPACITVPRDQPVTAIRQTALLRTAAGSFVYAVNGDAYRRTAVKVGAEADGWVEISDGVRPGDQVVTQSVQTLWLIELRATKGGGH